MQNWAFMCGTNIQWTLSKVTNVEKDAERESRLQNIFYFIISILRYRNYKYYEGPKMYLTSYISF